MGRTRLRDILIGGLLAMALASPALAQPACALPSPTVLASEGDAHAKGGRLVQRWDVSDAAVFWSTAEPAGYADFRARVARLAGETDPLKLLAQVPQRNNDIVAQSAAAWIRPATCLQKLLLQTQDRRIDTFTAPTEFASLILRSPDGARLRIYYLTVNQDGIGRMSPLTDPAKADHAAGWTVVAMLHNHGFHPGQPALNPRSRPACRTPIFRRTSPPKSGSVRPGSPMAWTRRTSRPRRSGGSSRRSRSQAFSTKLSMTFFSPALSNETLSLLPSTPMTLP